TRTRTTRKTPRAPRAPRHTGASTDTRMIVAQRDGGECVRCGKPASDQHHRLGRGAGGTHGEKSDTINQPAWLLVVGGSGGVSGCHGWIESNYTRAQATAYKIVRNGIEVDAQGVRVLTRCGWALFRNEGRPK